MAISISTALNADAQPVESFRSSTNITPQVESFQIAKSGDLTPSLYTGAMTYSLPLYTYSDPDFNIPISLEYNYDGYKVARSAGTVGLGWALNYGGVITREIRGLKDEYVQENYDGDGHSRYGFFWAYKNNVALSYQFTINRPRTPEITAPTPAELVRYLSDDLYEDYPVSTYGDSYDLSPDLFHFSFGPYSGDFIMKNNGTLTLTSSTHPQGEFDVSIESTSGMGGTALKFTIKTGDGYEYTFGDAVSAREYHISCVIQDECPDDNNIAGTMSGWTDTAWKLTKIKAPNGRTVLFSYAEKPNLTPTVTYSYSTYTQLLPTSEAMPAPSDSVPSWERTNLNYGYSHPIEQIRKKTTYGYSTLAGLSEYRFFNMMIGWMSFFQNRFYPKLSDIDETHYEPSYGAMSKMSFNTHYTYDRQTGQLLSESSGTTDKYRTTEFVYCSSNPTTSDACTLKAAVSDVITRISENNGALYTGKFHFGYQPTMKGLHPVSLTEYVLDIPSSASPSSANSRTETTTVTYNTLLRPIKVDMPGEAYIQYGWDNSGKHIISKTVNSEEGKTEYVWKDLVGLTSMKNPTGQITQYGYNTKGRLTGVRDSDSCLVVSYDIYLMSEGGTPQNRATTLKHLSEDGNVTVGDSKFYNGLGYLCQTISESASGDGKDLITPIEYDSMFEPDSKSYLPYPRNAGIWFLDNNSVINQQQWYFSKYYTQRPFMERTFENGLNGRPLTEQKPGNIYQTSSKRIHFSYSLNELSDSIFTFRYDYPASTSDHPSVVCTGKYQEGTLSKATAISEDNDTTQTFIDAEGRLVLERKLNDGIRHDTYHIYDLRDSVVCVIQPIGSSRLYSGKEMPFNGTFVQDSCFTWQYDGKGRMTESHTPGAGIKRFAYDLCGRMVYMDDSNLAELDNGRYFKYDNLNRITEEGVCSSPDISIIRSSLANKRSISDIVSKAKTIRSFIYYSVGNTNNCHNLSFQPAEGIVSNEDLSYERCKGLLSYEKVCEAPNYGVPYSSRELNSSSRFVERAYWYNKKGRLIQKAEKTDDGWTSRYSIKYDFAGNILNIMEMHTTPQGLTDSMLTTNTYDKRGRLLSYNRVLNGTNLAKVHYSYDWNGLLVKKVVNNADATIPLIEESYERSLQGRLSRINASAEHTDSLFIEDLYYTNPETIANPRYDGKISMTSVRTQNLSPMQCTYTYDNIGRLIGSKRYISGMDIGIGTEKDIEYDLNGNITKMTRSSGSEIGTYSYQMLYGYTGNRLSNGNTSIYNNDSSDPMRQLNFSYDQNGNMTVVAGSSEIRYNILNLPYITEHQTFSYLSDGTKIRVSDLFKGKMYLGNFAYERKGSENSHSLSDISFRDGVIVFNDNDLSKMSDLWFVKDHIGSVRSVYCLNDSTGNPIIEYNHFLPYGTRLDFLATEKSALNSHRFAGKKEYDDFLTSFDINPMDILANDFGARFFIPFTSCWTTPDPLASKHPSISPYTYCMSDPINYVDPFGLTNYVAGNHRYVINDGSDETIYLSRRLYQRLLNQLYDPDGHYWSMRQSIMDRNGYTDAAGNQVLAASQITSGINSSFSPLSISSSILSLSGDAMSNSNYSYRLTNSNKELDFVMYKNGWTGNQYVRTNKVSDLGESSRVMGKYFGIISLGVSSFQLLSADSPSAQLRSGLDVAFDIVGFIPEIGAPISLIWSLGGSSLFDAYTDMLMQQIDTTTGRIPMYYYMTDY